MPSRLGALLNMKTTSLEKVVYFQDYVVIDPGDTPLRPCQLLTEEEARQRAPSTAKSRSRSTWGPKRSKNCFRSSTWSSSR